MTAIGGAVHSLSIHKYPADIAGQSTYLLVQRANIRQQSGNQIACVFTISSLSRANHTRTFWFYLVNCASLISGSRGTRLEWIAST
jgi:hypothetical protein